MSLLLLLAWVLALGAACPHESDESASALNRSPQTQPAPPPAPTITAAMLSTMLKAPLTPRHTCADAPSAPKITLPIEVWAATDVSRGALTKALARLGAWSLVANINVTVYGDVRRFRPGPLVAAPKGDAGPDVGARLSSLRPFFEERATAASQPVRVVFVRRLFAPRDPIQRMFGEGAGIGLCPQCAQSDDERALYSAIGAPASAPGVAFVSVDSAARDTLAHELLHARGLVHIAETANIMHPQAGERRCAPVLNAAQRASLTTVPASR